MKDLRVAAAMMKAVVGAKTDNLRRARSLARAAAAGGAHLLVLPEACLTGYTVRETMAPWAEPVPGPLTEALTELAAAAGLVVLAGLVETDPNHDLYLTQVMVGPSGLLGAYRKTHLGPTERHRFSPGQTLGLVDALGCRFGLQMCYEGHFPEMALAQALKGAEIILIPHASPREEAQVKLERWLRYLPARAYDNTVFVVACNLAGDNGGGLDFSGVALIIGPKGEVLAQAAGNQDRLVFADLKAEELNNVKAGRMGFFLPIRRPEVYGLT
jgi:N-carbamoylputrescine amidase